MARSTLFAFALAALVVLCLSSSSSAIIIMCFFPDRPCGVQPAQPERIKVAVRSDIFDAVTEASATYGVESNLIFAVIKQESNFNPRELSSAGARGLMQLIPDTAYKTCPRVFKNKEDLYKVRENVLCGTKYLREMLRQFTGIPPSLAAYNAGPNRVWEWLRQGKDIPGGIPFAETREFVQRVTDFYSHYSFG